MRPEHVREGELAIQGVVGDEFERGGTSDLTRVHTGADSDAELLAALLELDCLRGTKCNPSTKSSAGPPASYPACVTEAWDDGVGRFLRRSHTGPSAPSRPGRG
jgi:hypothetical protein